MKSFTTAAFTSLFGLVSIAMQAQAAQRGLAWGADNTWASAFANSSVSWYHHWQLPAVSSMSNLEYVPMNWGPLYAARWAKRVTQMQVSQPDYILAYNEPDVPSQANMTPVEAAEAFVLDLEPWRQAGVMVSSPQIVWNITWMDEFMSELQSRGSDVDFMAIHYYGAWNDLATPKSYIQKVRSRYGKKLWITELGTTLESNGTESQVRSFMNSMMTWIDGQSYIDRVTWTGLYGVSTPPDSYIDYQDAMFYDNGTLRGIGMDFAKITPVQSTTTTATVTTTTTASMPSSTKSSSSSSASTTTMAMATATKTLTTTKTATATSTSITTSTAMATATTTKTITQVKIVTSVVTAVASSKPTTTTTASSSKKTTSASKTTTKAPSSPSTTKTCTMKKRVNKGNVVSAAKKRDLEK